MTCRAVLRADCAATPITGGQALTYDQLGRLIAWQGDPAHWPGQASYAYDGEGRRVYMQGTTSDASGTYSDTWVYGAATPYSAARRSYGLPGGVTALRDGTGLHYLAADALGTPILTYGLTTGSVLGTQLRAPYGQPRLAARAGSNGGMHTTRGFTGQREDAQGAGAGVGASGLDDFNARYYDPAIGRFTAADSVRGADALGDNYAYVGGHVENATDPTGHRFCEGDDTSSCRGGGKGSGDTGSPPPPPTSGPVASHKDQCHADSCTPKSAADLTCQASAKACRAIQDDFGDKRTQLLLIALTYTILGLDFLPYILRMASMYGGDRFIQWWGKDAYNNSLGIVYLDNRILPDVSDLHGSDGLQVLAGLAGSLIHEVTESFYTLDKGIVDHASQHMDYVAQVYGTKEKSEILNAWGQPQDRNADAYQRSFNSWINGADGANYLHQPDVYQREVHGGDFSSWVLHRWADLMSHRTLDNVNYMGLSADVLNNDDLRGYINQF